MLPKTGLLLMVALLTVSACSSDATDTSVTEPETSSPATDTSVTGPATSNPATDNVDGTQPEPVNVANECVLHNVTPVYDADGDIECFCSS